MDSIYRSVLLVILLAYILVGLSAHGLLGWGQALGGHQQLGLAVAITGALAHSLPLSYFMGSGYLIKFHAEAAGAGPEWKQRHSAWLRSRGYPVIFGAGLAVVLTGVAGGLVDTGRLAPHWHAGVALIALGACLLELRLVPPLMRRNRQLVAELKANHTVPVPGTEAARRLVQRQLDESVHPLYQLARILLYVAFNALGLWAWLHFGTEGYRTVPLLPFALAFLLMATPGLALYWRHHPSRPRSSRRASSLAVVMAALTGVGLGGPRRLKNTLTKNIPGRLISGRCRTGWRSAQLAMWLIGVALLSALVLTPTLGLHAFWNVLIPIAPLLVALSPGLWRNICPLGTTALFARHQGWSKQHRLSTVALRRLELASVVLLLVIVPMRHVVLDLNGPATAVTIVALAVVAVVMGRNFEWKSGWCSGLCPVHQVEKLYGSSPLLTVRNAHCEPCGQCVDPCVDGKPDMNPLVTSGARVVETAQTAGGSFAGKLMVGGFVGFIWGWFQVPDRPGPQGWAHLGEAYALPIGAMLATWALFMVLRSLVRPSHQRTLTRVFAAAAIACYYWYRLPALFGFGLYPGDGMLVDLSADLPAWTPYASNIVTTAFFAWWMVGRSTVLRSWQIRPGVAASRVSPD